MIKKFGDTMDMKDDNGKRALIVASVGRFFEFERNDIFLLQNQGYTVDLAANFEELECDDFYAENVNRIQIDFSRSPFSLSSFHVLERLMRLFADNYYQIIHCHTPTAAFLTRLAAKKTRRRGSIIIYTAHGFHFYKGAPLRNWLFYFPVELYSSRFTDYLIVINKEDYQIAKNKLHASNVRYVPGIGIDLVKYSPTRCVEHHDPVLKLISVGELSDRKNHAAVIKQLQYTSENVHYDIVGEGAGKKMLEDLIHSTGLENRVKLLGRRENIPELLSEYDIFVFPSKQEGLPVALMEAMAMELPIIASDIRGNNDLIPPQSEQLFSLNNPKDILKKISYYNSSEIRNNIGKENRKRVLGFSKQIVTKKMERIYKEVENEKTENTACNKWDG